MSTGPTAIMEAECSTTEIELAVKFGSAAAHTAETRLQYWLAGTRHDPPQPGWEQP